MAASSFSLAVWHDRFLQQARWTQDLRRHLFDRAGLAGARRVLEVGCGTGALTSNLGAPPSVIVDGIDLNPTHVTFARQHDGATRFVAGDGCALPYPSAAFDLVFCHYFLLWVRDSRQVLAEMKRVTRLGGYVLALAEPDYGGRIDYPAELTTLGEWQIESLQRQGADPYMGRRLAGLFAGAGLQDIETGVLGGQWRGPLSPEARESEWTMLEADLRGEASPEVLHWLRALDNDAWQRGERILYVPTFYAWGRV